MKRIFLLFWLSLLLIEGRSQDALGDIKYSVLAPAQFIALHPGWILMDGGATPTSDSIFKTSKLHDSLGILTFPDGRGVFIRGMNENRKPTEGNADGNKDMGIEQMDVFQSHTHPLINNNIYNTNLVTRNPNGVEFTQQSFGHPQTDLVNINAAITVGNSGGNETRPRNIPLYVYIKVN